MQIAYMFSSSSDSNAARRYDDGCHVSRPLRLLHARSWLGCRCDYSMFSRIVDTCRRPVVLMVSHYELHDDELAWWHSSLAESRRITSLRHELIAAMCYAQLRCLAIALWRCLIVFPVDPMRPHVPGTYLPDAPACARHSIMVVEVSPSAE